MSPNPANADRIYHRPAIPITLAIIAGIVTGDRFPGGTLPVVIILMASGIWMIRCLMKQRSVRWTPLAALAAAGYLAMVPWVSPRFGPNHIVHHIDDGYWQISGRVADRPTVRFGRTRLALDVTSLARAKDSHPVRGRIRLTIMGEMALSPGDRVSFRSRLRPLRNFNNPGGFDYRRYMAFQGIFASAWVKAENLRLYKANARPPVSGLLDDCRQHLGRLIDMAGGEPSSDAKAVLKALVYGDRSGIDDALRERFNRSGVGHLLAISGLHVGIVAAVAYRTLVWLLAFIPPLLWRGWSRPWAAAATVLVVLAYGLLAGMSPSTQRAVIMVTVFLAALIVGRTHDILNSLAVAAMAILVLFPPALFSISFQLSFAAVLAIVVGLDKLGWIERHFLSAGNAVGRWLIGLVLVSALAIAGTTPLALYYFNQTSLVGIAANLLLVPLVGFVAVPLGLVAAVGAIFSSALATAGFDLCIAILRLAMVIVDGFAGFSFAAVKTVTPSLLEIALYYMAAWALLSLKTRRVAPWLLALTLVLAVGDAFYWTYQRFWHRDLRITAIDVGQGAATLMELPGGKVLLYDGGGFADNRLFDTGRLIIAPLLWDRKIATVNILALSHPNADHLNGLIYVAKHFKVSELWTNGDANTTWGYRELMDVCRERSIAVKSLDRSCAAVNFGAVALEILHPPPESPVLKDNLRQERRNDLSLVLKTTFGATAFLFTGDITADAEASLAEHSGDDLVSTVLFAPHHGSQSSSSAALVAMVRPDIVVISAGAGNRFGFPHPEVVDRYRNAGSRIFCTATRGATTFRSDGKTVQVATVVDAAETSPIRPKSPNS